MYVIKGEILLKSPVITRYSFIPGTALRGVILRSLTNIYNLETAIKICENSIFRYSYPLCNCNSIAYPRSTILNNYFICEKCGSVIRIHYINVKFGKALKPGQKFSLRIFTKYPKEMLEAIKLAEDLGLGAHKSCGLGKFHVKNLNVKKLELISNKSDENSYLIRLLSPAVINKVPRRYSLSSFFKLFNLKAGKNSFYEILKEREGNRINISIYSQRLMRKIRLIVFDANSILEVRGRFIKYLEKYYGLGHFIRAGFGEFRIMKD